MPGAALPSPGREASLPGGLEQRRGTVGGAEGKGQCEEGLPGAGGGSGFDRRAAQGSGEPGRLECHTPRGAQAAINLKSLGILLAFSKYY